MSALIGRSAGDNGRAGDAAHSGCAALGLTCPRCQGDVLRVRRRRVDLLISFFTPIRRFRCQSMECGWEGNFRIKRFPLLI